MAIKYIVVIKQTKRKVKVTTEQIICQFNKLIFMMWLILN